MLIREVLPEEKEQFNQAVNHPLQSWEWGEFREKTGKKVIRLGVFDPATSSEKEKLKTGYQLTVHPIPQTNFTLFYFPRGSRPDRTMINALLKLGQKERAILVKLDPNVYSVIDQNSPTDTEQKIDNFLAKNDCRKTKPFWFEYSFQINLNQTETQLLSAMHPKARYNIRLAQRHGVEITEDDSKEAFEIYLQLMMETTKRQKFYAHTPEYHRQMWEILHPAGMAHLMLARHQGKILAAWILFTFNKVLYYPYGGSSREAKEVMPAYALMWEAIKFGQKQHCHTFDLWGCLGPKPDSNDPWFGFHRFKSGFGGKLIRYIGTYDLIIDYRLYSLYNFANELRWKLLKLKAGFSL